MSVIGRFVGAATVLVLCGLMGVASAQERQAGVDVQAGGTRVTVDAKQTHTQGDAAVGTAFRASGIQGMTVKNDAGQELGTVNDLVIDVQAGQVNYAALSYGGFLGLGDKLFAVPWNAFGCRHDADSDEYILVLNINEETLKQAPGYDQDKWPNFADPNVSGAITKHYGKLEHGRDQKDTAASTERRAGVDIQAGPVAVKVDAERDRVPADRDPDHSAKAMMLRAGKIIGLTIQDPAGKELGSVNDLVIDMDTGHVRYAALSYGGIVGIGNKLFAVPWNAFDCQYNQSDEKYAVVLAADVATLKGAPGFDQSDWPDLANPKFRDEIDKYYEGTRRPSDTTDAAARAPERSSKR